LDKLEEEVQQLTDICAEKDDELDGLRAWKSQMMALAMGPSAEAPSRRANRESGARKSIVTTARQHHKRKSVMQPNHVAPQTNTAIEDVANAPFTSSESSERNGSTPKRAKRRLSFKAVDMRTPYKQKPNLARPSQSGTKQVQKRVALGETSFNRRHTTVGFTAASKDEEYEDEELNAKRRGSLQYGTQPSFDMDRSLASSPFTPGRLMCGTGRDPGDETEDVTLEL